MSAINVTSVEVLDNPTNFANPLQFEIQYECLYQLAHDLEWKLIYVGSAESEEYDQVLDSVLVGPVYPGQYRFVFQSNPPDPAKLRGEDIMGITVILLTCSYNSKEFIRVGYYVNNEYPESEEQLREEPPEKPILEKLVRNILADKPRVTKFPVEFDPPPEDMVPLAGTAFEAAPEEGAAEDMLQTGGYSMDGSEGMAMDSGLAMEV